ncbi:ATP-binding protein [Streptomyces griseoflavus]|uniref:ATP-binding protein n=1 Tax=Streptomyces griseoflavus TaxID=35619 RepID=UPI003F687858
MPSVHGGAIVASVIPSAPLGTDAAAGSVGLGAASAPAPWGTAAERRFRFELAAHLGSPAQARRLTRARLTGWSVCEDTCETAELVVSELVTNAIVHTASSHIVCELHEGGDLVRIAVRDEGCAPDRPRANTRQRPDDEHGRGLLLVDALCHSWGAHEQGPGLLVWADLPHKADAPGDPAEPRNDLGWGARPKPGPAGGSDDGHDEDHGGDHGDADSGESARLRPESPRNGGAA